MIIARIIRSDCNLITLGKRLASTKENTLNHFNTEYCIRRNNTSRLQASSLNDLKISHFTTQSENRQN